MASLEEAFSTEYGDTVDPELAYDLYWAGVITDKSAFLCPSEKCDAKVTCINIDKDRQDMHQTPHFRGYNHSEECDVTRENDGGAVLVDGGDEAHATVTKSEYIPDVFHLNRPQNQFAKKIDERGHPKPKSKSNKKRAKLIGDGKIEGGSDYYSVRSLVTKFIRYRKEGTLSEHKVNISGKDISYESLFKGVYKQQLSMLPDEGRIYWGVAFVDYLEKQKCYRVSFGSPLSLGIQEIRPAFFIHQSDIESYPVRNLVVKRLEKVNKSKDSRAFVFLYSKPYSSTKNEKKYITFEFDSLDYLEIRYLDLFEDLKT